MSILRIRYFASLREQVGVEREDVAIPAAGVTLMDLLERLGECHGAEVVEALTHPGVRIALNDDLLDTMPGLLRPGDEVAFLPPVTGG